jgi:hypothetical protein
MKSREIGTSCLLLAALSSCAPSPQILKRYDTATYSDAEHDPNLTVSTFTVDMPDAAATSPKLAGLSDRGQAAYIAALAAVIKTPSDLKDAISKPFAIAGDDSAVDTKRVLFTKRLVITLQKSQFRPADRVSEVTVTVTFPSSIRLLSWEKLENAYITVDQGSLALQQGNKFDVSTGISIPAAPFVKPIQVSGEETNSLSETQPLTRSFIRFSGELHDHSVTLYQEGDTQLDVSGTVAASLKLAFLDSLSHFYQVFRFKELFSKEGTPQSSAKVKVAKAFIFYPGCSGDLAPVSVKASYTIRKVLHGDATLTEGDDAVVFAENNTVALPDALGTVVRKAEKEFDYFTLFDENGGYLEIVDPSAGASGNRLIFATFSDAADFLQWLNLSRVAPHSVGAWKIVQGNRQQLTKASIARLQIDRDSTNEMSGEASTGEEIKPCQSGSQ